MKPIRIGIIGFGKIAADQHMPAIEGNPRFELVATSSRSGQGVGRTFTDWRELAQSGGVDAVAITTPPGPRYDIARECLLAGLHCLLEKPPTTGLSEINDLACLAEAQGEVSLYATWHARHHPPVDAAARALAGKRIAAMEIVWHEDVHKWHPGQKWVWDAGGFGVFDPGINAFSIATKIFPGSLFVKRAELLVPENAQTPIAVDVAFSSPEADGPLTASLDWRRTEGEEWTITITTADGCQIRLEDGGAKLMIDGKEQSEGGIGEYPDIYREFLELIDERRSLVDVAPLRLVADCLLAGSRRRVEPVTL